MKQLPWHYSILIGGNIPAVVKWLDGCHIFRKYPQFGDIAALFGTIIGSFLLNLEDFLSCMFSGANILRAIPSFPSQYSLTELWKNCLGLLRQTMNLLVCAINLEGEIGRKRQKAC
eukprot:7585981-Ditylum_brightwellii.AAC.1